MVVLSKDLHHEAEAHQLQNSPHWWPQCDSSCFIIIDQTLFALGTNVAYSCVIVITWVRCFFIFICKSTLPACNPCRFHNDLFGQSKQINHAHSPLVNKHSSFLIKLATKELLSRIKLSWAKDSVIQIFAVCIHENVHVKSIYTDGDKWLTVAPPPLFFMWKMLVKTACPRWWREWKSDDSVCGGHEQKHWTEEREMSHYYFTNWLE